MKRHKTIIPLSHDHHVILKLAQEIKRNFIKTVLGKSSIENKVKHVISTFKKELLPHFNHEENILFPLAKGKDAELDRMIDEIIEEHDKIGRLVSKIEVGDKEQNLDDLGFLLESHIRKEERIVFSKIEEILGDELNIIEGQIYAKR
ncbi:MAG: hemerythrin domain-containing protein [Melioribacteraceae bacterium]|nr:hemerythrin domain-containing protein [Melioribacteraceae bacterium]